MGQEGSEIEAVHDPRFERYGYVVRNVAAVAGALALVAGLLGLFGDDGPLNSADAASPGNEIRVDYDRFLQLRTPDELKIEVGGGGGKASVALSREYVESVEIDGFSVEPRNVTSLPDRVAYTFDVRAPAEVILYFDPREIGRQRATVYGPGDSSASFTQWVYP